ncbi:MAG: hypothetical protein WCF04_02115 [Candidatus Nanopelagicales bacterium]
MTTTPDVATPVDRAVEELRKQFAGHEMSIDHEFGGDAVVIIENIHVGDQYAPSATWLGFRISAAYPNADIYPHHIGPVGRRDGGAHGAAVQRVTWKGRPALQLSRRSNGWNPRRDTAALKAAKVLAWFADQ